MQLSRLGIALACFAIMLGTGLSVPGCGSESETYTWEQGSAQEVLDSALVMVEDGEVRYLTELIWAEDEMRRTYLRGIGSVLQSLHDLSMTAADRFGPEVQQILEAGERARAEGQGMNIIGRLAGRAGRGEGAGRFMASDDFLNDITQSLITDPYGFIERNKDTLGVEEYDEGYFLTIDERPTLLGFIELFREMDDGNWYVVIPDRIITVDTEQFWPRDEQELEIALAVMKVLKNALEDVRLDIEQGRARSLDKAAENLGKYLAVPLPLAFAAYGSVIEAREAEDAAGEDDDE